MNKSNPKAINAFTPLCGSPAPHYPGDRTMELTVPAMDCYGEWYPVGTDYTPCSAGFDNPANASYQKMCG